MKAIDIRFRPHTKDVMDGIHEVFREYCETSTFLEEHPARPIEQEVAMLRELNVVKAVITARDVSSTTPSTSGNIGMIECVDKFPDMFIGSYGIDPIPTMRTIKGFKAALREHNVHGGATDPAHAHVAVDDPRYYPFYAICCEEDIPVTITTGLHDGAANTVWDHVAPWRIDKVATHFPELKIIVSHAGYPFIYESIGLGARHPNVYLDLSSCSYLPNLEPYVNAANGILMTKLLFGSASPFNFVKEALDWHASLPLTPEAQEHLFYKNAAQLYRCA